MDIDVKKLAGELGLNYEFAMEYTMTTELYASALQRFCKNHEANKEKVLSAFSIKDFENYMITVHSLKSNAKMIGATKLSEAFEELEMAAKENDLQFIQEKNKAVLDDYDELVAKLKPITEIEEIHADEEITAEEAREVIDQLLEALDDFDDELSLKLAKKLYGYPFRITGKEKLKKAMSLISDFMYDESAEIIKQIVDMIE